MERDTRRMRGERPFVFGNLRAGEGVDAIARFIEEKGGLGGSASVASKAIPCTSAPTSRP